MRDITYINRIIAQARKNRDMNKQAIIETLKSTARFIWFGLLGVVVVALTALLTAPEVVSATVNIAGLDISIGFIIVAVIGAVIKAVDTYIHQNKDLKLNGIAPSFLQK
jgi:uncharacterized membrane protein